MKCIKTATGNVVFSFKSCVKLSDADWRLFGEKAQDANAITREMTNSGSTPEQINTAIQELFQKNGIPSSKVEVLCHNTGFVKPFTAQVWKDSNKVAWKEMQTLFAERMAMRPVPKSRNAMSKALRMTRVPLRHSAMSVVNHTIAMQQRIVRDGKKPTFYVVPTFEGLNRKRDLEILKYTESQDEDTEKMINGAVGFPTGSAEWKEWQKNGLAASDAPCIMGGWSYDRTAEQLLLEKRGQAEPQPLSEHAKRGSELEPRARQAFTDATGMALREVSVQSPKHDWLRVRIDGVTNDGEVLVECICPGDKTYESARGGILSKHSLYKIQTLLAACPEAKHAIAWVFDPNKGGLAIKVMPDKRMQDKILQKMHCFWNEVNALVDEDFGGGEVPEAVDLDEAPVAAFQAPQNSVFSYFPDAIAAIFRRVFNWSN
jgi:putative phage-type endonuclease